MLDPCLLVASPSLRDRFFERAVVLLWQHDEDGAFGVIVNRPLDVLLEDVLMPLDDADVSGHTDYRVVWGGPVDNGSGTVVTTAEVDAEEGDRLPGGLSITRSRDALAQLIREDAPLLLCLGYGAWGPGQLESEIADGTWIVVEADASLVFDLEPETIYERALGQVGLDANTVWLPPVDE